MYDFFHEEYAFVISVYIYVNHMLTVTEEELSAIKNLQRQPLQEIVENVENLCNKLKFCKSLSIFRYLSKM